MPPSVDELTQSGAEPAVHAGAIRALCTASVKDVAMARADSGLAWALSSSIHSTTSAEGVDKLEADVCVHHSRQS